MFKQKYFKIVTKVVISSKNWAQNLILRGISKRFVAAKCSIILLIMRSKKNHELESISSLAGPLDTTHWRAISSCNTLRDCVMDIAHKTFSWIAAAVLILAVLSRPLQRIELTSPSVSAYETKSGLLLLRP